MQENIKGFGELEEGEVSPQQIENESFFNETISGLEDENEEEQQDDETETEEEDLFTENEEKELTGKEKEETTEKDKGANEEEFTEDDEKSLFEEIATEQKETQETGIINEIATELGIEGTDDQPITKESVLQTVKNLKQADDDEEVKQFKLFKALNPESTLLEYKNLSGIGEKEALSLDDRTLYVEYLVAVKKETDEDAREIASECVANGTLKDKVNTIREKLTERLKEKQLALKEQLETEKEKRNNIAIENQKALLASMKENREMFGGYFKTSKSEIIDAIKYVQSGGLEKAIKDPKQASKIIYFLKNEEKIINAIKSNMLEEGKALILEKLELRTTKPKRVSGSQGGRRDDAW